MENCKLHAPGKWRPLLRMEGMVASVTHQRQSLAQLKNLTVALASGQIIQLGLHVPAPAMVARKPETAMWSRLLEAMVIVVNHWPKLRWHLATPSLAASPALMAPGTIGHRGKRAQSLVVVE